MSENLIPGITVITDQFFVVVSGEEPGDAAWDSDQGGRGDTKVDLYRTVAAQPNEGLPPIAGA